MFGGVLLHLVDGLASREGSCAALMFNSALDPNGITKADALLQQANKDRRVDFHAILRVGVACAGKSANMCVHACM